MNIALVTWEGLPSLDPDDRRLAASLVARGATTVPAVWSDPSILWEEFDVTIVRSTWDYHRRLGEFLAWVDRVGALGRLLNIPATLRWNCDKRYLLDLARAGVRIPPTVWGPEVRSVTETMRERGWREAVVKPTVSASGEGTYRLRVEDGERNEERLRSLRARGDVMLQPYLPGVERPGERSLVFLGGEYSHAVVRRPKLAGATGLEEGAPISPDPAERELAGRAVAAVDPVPVYARVDLVPDLEGVPCVAELELIEPLLYLGAAPGAPDRLAEAILRAVATSIPASGSTRRG